MNKIITCWYKEVGENNELHYNHLTVEQYSPELKSPIPKTPEQKIAWAKQKWHSRPATIVDGVVVEAPLECPIGLAKGFCSAGYCKPCIDIRFSNLFNK